METPCWSCSEGLQHGGRKPVETSGVYFGSLKTFILSVKLENIRIGTSLVTLATQKSRRIDMGTKTAGPSFEDPQRQRQIV